MHSDLQKYVKSLLSIYNRYKACYELDQDPEGFEWMDPDDYTRSIYSFVRKTMDGRDSILYVCNFTPVARDDYRVGVPKKKQYTLILDSEDARFGGSGKEKPKTYTAVKSECDSRPYSLAYPLPAYGVAVFKF